jgi:hypothetical protein
MQYLWKMQYPILYYATLLKFLNQSIPSFVSGNTRGKKSLVNFVLWIFVSNLITQSCSLGMLCMCVCVCVCACATRKRDMEFMVMEWIVAGQSTQATKLNNPRSSTPLEVQSSQIQLRKQFLLEACGVQAWTPQACSCGSLNWMEIQKDSMILLLIIPCQPSTPIP